MKNSNEQDNKDTLFSLHNSENFKKELESERTEILEKLVSLLTDYFQFITEKLKLKYNNFSRFIVMRGINTIITVFNYLLFYTKNLNLTYYHCQKSFYFYVEFVGQISEDEKMFLQLTSRDATSYVYKKTIFEINGESKKNNEIITPATKIKLDQVNEYVLFYRSLFDTFINGNFSDTQLFNTIKKIMYKTILLNEKSFNAEQTKISILNNIFQKIANKIDNNIFLFDVIYCCLLRLIRSHKKMYNIESKIYSDEFSNNLIQSAEEFATWIMI